jgi:hypothetical protein
MRNLTSEEFSVFWGAIYAAILTLGFCALWPHTFWWGSVFWGVAFLPCAVGARINRALSK